MAFGKYITLGGGVNMAKRICYSVRQSLLPEFERASKEYGFSMFVSLCLMNLDDDYFCRLLDQKIKSLLNK
jgi:hypothetical protein